MRNKKPPFEITNAMIDHVTEIAELVGRLTSTNQLSANSTLRRTNRIRTIHRAEHADFGAGHGCPQRQAGFGSS